MGGFARCLAAQRQKDAERAAKVAKEAADKAAAVTADKARVERLAALGVKVAHTLIS
jgi:hypothetical protein